MQKDNFLARAVESGGRMRVRSALNPALWMCAIVSMPSLGIHSMFGLPEWLLAVTCAPIVVAMFGYLFFMAFDRDKLQSEDYQIRKRSLEMIEQSSGGAPISADQVTLIANPQEVAGADNE